QERYPSDPDAPGGLHEAIRTQRPTYMFRIAPELLEQGARDAEHREILRALALTGYICVPLVSYGRAFGAITFVSAESGHVYDESDIRMAQELAHRAALAVENARAYARATEASRVKDDFLATLSHELRTPLNAVLGYVRMLQLHSVPPERTDSALNIIERNALALQRMIEDVLDVSRFVAGGVRLRLEPVSLAGLVEDTCASCLPTAHAKEIRLEHYFCDGVTTVSADPQRLRQVVWNLLSNAIKFTGNGGTVRVSLRVMDPCVELEVRDTGRGIAPDFLPAVFERFRQENATFSREYGGLGLGLALAKQLTELHGGTIRAASDGLGMGATFTVTLPLATPGAQLGRSDRSGSLER
ncbi:MAG: ATP-binding protein, partial [Vicinamibacterales bacterium]